jgi:hypothetical protein
MNDEQYKKALEKLKATYRAEYVKKHNKVGIRIGESVWGSLREDYIAWLENIIILERKGFSN